jgi:hypothetical protein
MNHFSIITYFWLPSVFIYDVAFLGVVYGGFFFRTPCRVLVVLFTTILVLFTAIVVAFQVTALVGFHGATIPWNLSFWAIMEWAHFKILVKAKSTEAWLQVWMVALISSPLDPYIDIHVPKNQFSFIFSCGIPFY